VTSPTTRSFADLGTVKQVGTTFVYCGPILEVVG
jgi:hypothetical protein